MAHLKPYSDGTPQGSPREPSPRTLRREVKGFLQSSLDSGLATALRRAVANAAQALLADADTEWPVVLLFRSARRRGGGKAPAIL